MLSLLPAFALVLLMIPGVALLIATRLLFGRQAKSSSGLMPFQLSMLAWLMIWLSIIGALVGMFGLGPMLIVLLLGVLLVSPMVWIRLRRAEHRALVGAIVTGIGRGVPMPDMARAYAGEVAGGTGARARALAAMLEAGVPLDAAVVRAPLWLGTGMHVAIRMGCAIDMLGPALTRELRSSREMEDLVQPLAPRLWYLSLVIALALSILTFVMLKIVPVFDRVFAGFELPLPAVTEQLIDVARGVADLGPVTVALVGPFLGTLLLATLAYIGILPRSLPVLDRLFRRYDGAIVLRSLSLAVKRGLPMPAAMALVGNVYPLRSVRRWLLAAAGRAAGGVPWCDSLLATRLIGRSDAAVLRAAERAGNLAWAMEELADGLVRREVYRWQWWYNTLSPAVILLFGLVVAFIVIGLFVPLVALIQGMSR